MRHPSVINPVTWSITRQFFRLTTKSKYDKKLVPMIDLETSAMTKR